MSSPKNKKINNQDGTLRKFWDKEEQNEAVLKREARDEDVRKLEVRREEERKGHVLNAYR